MTSTLPLSQLLFEDGHMKQDLLVNTGEAELSKERTGEAAVSVSEIITSAFPSKMLYKCKEECKSSRSTVTDSAEGQHRTAS